MSRNRGVAAFGIGCVALGAIACIELPGGFSGEPAVQSVRAKLGDTASMAIDSNYVPGFEDQYERYNLSKDNVSLEIRKTNNTSLAVIQGSAIRSVFDGFSTPTSSAATTQPGAYVTVVMFDLPTALPGLTPPATTKIRLLVDGVPANPIIEGKLEIVTGTGSGTDYIPESDPATLQPRPTLRLRPQFDSDWSDGFADSSPVGGIAFTLEFPTAKLDNPDAFVASEAYRASVWTGPETVPGRVRVVLSDPRGFTVAEKDIISGPSRAGEGPIVDVAFDKVPGQGFATSDFRVLGLEARDVDGALLTPVVAPDADTTSYFMLYARKNLAE